jgi:hypothetical protein
VKKKEKAIEIFTSYYFFFISFFFFFLTKENMVFYEEDQINFQGKVRLWD